MKPCVDYMHTFCYEENGITIVIDSIPQEAKKVLLTTIDSIHTLLSMSLRIPYCLAWAVDQKASNYLSCWIDFVD